jgi:hypothetical protein
MFALVHQFVELRQPAIFDPRSTLNVDPSTYYISGGFVNGQHHSQAGGVGLAPDALVNPWGAGIGCTMTRPYAARSDGAVAQDLDPPVNEYFCPVATP